MATNFCSVTDALAEAQFDVLKRINNKFDALRRLGELLEQLGDLSNLIPNISQLIPVINIDTGTYQNLRSACPFLNLPAADNNSLENLRNQVITAYSQLTSKVLNHPWMRMGKLQDQLSKFQQKVNVAFAQGGQYIRCLQAACQTFQSATSFVQRVGQTNITNQIEKFSTNFVTNAGQVLSKTGQQKLQDAQNVVTKMKALGADVKSDYATAKADLQSQSVITSAPTELSSHTESIAPNPVIVLPSEPTD